MALMKLVLAIYMVAMVKLLLDTTTVVENLSLAMALSTMEKLMLAIVMLAMEANILLGVVVAATPITHLLPHEVRAKGCGKVYSCPECKNTFFTTPQAQGGRISRRHRIMEKKKVMLDLQSVPHKCIVFNHVCQIGQELSFHMMSVHLTRVHMCITIT
jgi:hypothetical protein